MVPMEQSTPVASNATPHPYASPSLCDHFERQCNRFVNGGCTTRRCVVRGRDLNRDGLAPIYSNGQVSTCEAFEAAHLIASQIGRRYGPDYEMSDESRALAREEARREALAASRLMGVGDAGR